MSFVDTLSSLVSRPAPAGTLHVVDSNPLNWLYITYNTVEELVRMNEQGSIEPAAMKSFSWLDARTLAIQLRPDNVFPDGEPVTASTVKRSFDEMMRWQVPHPPGTALNVPTGTSCEIVDELTVHFHLPRPDGLFLGKLRAMHVMSTRFWEDVGFGYARQGTGEGHWGVIDAPGPWGTGPFELVEGFSSIDTELATISVDPFSATWLQAREDRTPTVRLAANPRYWDQARGPHLETVVFRNDLSMDAALAKVCDSEGEVDLVTEVPPEHAARVEGSAHATLVAGNAMRAVFGVINRDATGLPLADRRAREALNLAVDRKRLVDEVFAGYAEPLPALTPAWSVTLLHRLTPWGGQTADAPPLELHNQVVGAVGGLRAGPTVPAFEELFASLAEETSTLSQASLNYRLDQLVQREALALFLCSPQVLYAVNNEVTLTPYATSFELAQCRVSDQHWSRRSVLAAKADVV